MQHTYSVIIVGDVGGGGDDESLDRLVRTVLKPKGLELHYQKGRADFQCLVSISYQLFWSMIQLISRNQRAVSPEAHDCLHNLCTGNKNEHTYIHTNTGRLI